ncbi:ARM repeat-containing protein [Amniculicola lignicola CBS 123094]|uniref:ARM repeat-containing protein n=1 Tax=Amniculicola lignicola CBS 123094 TaxID=1392246 RepID=A0A6A5WWT4_9PLEO|nr:ARM repeat-containing protein [Amniculicola lignicola CBS 123094]
MSLNITSDGSPTPRKGSSRFSMAEDLRIDTSPEGLGTAVGSRHPFPTWTTFTSSTPYRATNALLTANLQGVKRPNSTSYDLANTQGSSGRRILPPLQGLQRPHIPSRISTETYKKLKVDADFQREHDSSSFIDPRFQRSSPLDQHNNGKTMRCNDWNALKHMSSVEPDGSSNGSNPITPATDEHADTPSTEPDTQRLIVDVNEYQRLQQQLADAKKEVARMNQELHASHVTKSTLDQAIGQSNEPDYSYFKDDVTEQTISQLQNKFNASTRPSYTGQGWPGHDVTDAQSEKSDAKPFFGEQAIWSNAGRQPSTTNSVAVNQPYAVPTSPWNVDGARSFYGGNVNMGVSVNPTAFGPGQPQSRPPSTGQNSFRARGYLNEPAHFPLDQGYRGALASNPPTRPGSAFDAPSFNQYLGYANGIGRGASGDGASPNLPTMPMPPAGMGMYGSSGMMTPYQPRPIGTMNTRLSPEAPEFSVDVGPGPWNPQQSGSDSGSQFMAPAEPMNYRRLLDRNMNCNWKYIVDKIICNNDQQASIFLQQKLKVGTAEQKFEIVEAIIAQAYPLMVNRFGNFLVQRCFEHGTPEQVIAIAGTIRGNTLTLSMDAFGCHVIQKAFDCVPEEYKATMVHELLRRIPETIIHRYACHVWQKLFELRWSDSPPQIMRYVNEALRGMWHEVALGETGSLVVQNIFENCLEEDKRPCINEVLASIDVIAHGQFGNWCIQHICEHGAPADRNRAIDHILRFSTEYSMDQYASKVIEKCLKIGGNDFLDRYLDRVYEARQDRPRMPLIDIAGDQFGNYLIQYILTNSNPHHRELVASHVRKHMVSLRGSKYGSRVAMLCCNPAVATRPGPPAGMQVNRYSTHSVHRGGGGGGGGGGGSSNYGGYR